MILRVHNIRAGYGDRAIIDNISFEIAPGEIMALFGHNGAGKSTTLRAILGLIPITSGEIWLAGDRIDGLSVSDRIERGLRLLPEGRGIFPDLTVAENLAVVLSANGGEINSGLSVDEVYGLFPVLAEKRKALAGSMSGGQQQMLSFGLAVMGSPRCVLLEEPSVGLQPDLVEQLFAQIGRICKERQLGAVLIEHKISSALDISDHVLILNNGRMVFSGTREVTRATDIWKYF